MEEKKIIDLFFARSELAIELCRVHYGAYCRTIARNILDSGPDAEECENDVYLAAWNTIPPTRPENLRAFLGRMTRNIALDRWDRRRAAKRGGEMELLLSELQDCAGGGDPEAEFTAKELGRAISAFLRKLDERKRMLFLRRYWYCDSIAELSERFDMTPGRVKTALFRIRKKLREDLIKEGYLCE